MAKKIEIGSAGRLAIIRNEKGEKPNLEVLLGLSDITERPLNTATEAIIITPAHREDSIEVLNQGLPPNVLPIIHINDHPIGVHHQLIFDDRFVRTLRDYEEIRDIDGHPHVVTDSYHVAYDDQTSSPTIKKTKTYTASGTTREIEQYILGPVTGLINDEQAFTMLYGPSGIFSVIDTVLNGRMKNMLLHSYLQSLNSPMRIIDSSHIRNLVIVNHEPYSIGRARALPIKHLLENDTDLNTPIFWNDADAFFEPGVLEFATNYYKNNPEVMAAFFPRRAIVPHENIEPYNIINHAKSELMNTIHWLKEKTFHYMGGPQISSRLEIYTNVLEISEAWCNVSDCSDRNCKHPKPTHSSTALEMLANCQTDEDFSFAKVLTQVLTPTDQLVMLPKRVWIHNRGEERQRLTAVNGDAGNHHHEYPQLMFGKEGEEEATLFIINFLKKYHIDISANTFPELLDQLLQIPAFATIFEEEWAMYMKHGLSMVSPDYIEQKPENDYAKPIKEMYKIAIMIYATQIFLIQLALKS